MNQNIYHIIETANTHGGNIEYLYELIDMFSEFRGNFGMKFQPFKYDLISTKNYSWYATYKELFFDSEQWTSIIDKTSRHKDIWLDLFDSYSVEILRQNHKSIYGIKLQASVLYNYSLFNELESIDLSNIYFMINIAGFNLKDIQSVLEKLRDKFSPKSFIIQFGFQDYPTKLNDAGIAKIKTLKDRFPEYELCFADHIDGKSDDGLILPLIAVFTGCRYIEKHVYHDEMETKYDQFSSINYTNYKQLVNRIKKYLQLFNKPFINERELNYLEESIQIPIISNSLKEGDLISLQNDVEFKRTESKGLHAHGVIDLQAKYFILNKEKKEGEVINKNDFKKAKLATIIACRMKSSRLPQKAILKIGELSSIELCLKNALEFENIDYTILATSTIEEDSQLKKYTYSDEVIFHQGDPIDVIQRYLDICNKLDIGIIMRVTGDCPYMSKDIHSILLKSHMEKGADYTSASNACIGMNVEIINTNVLRKIKEYFPYADYSEYMTFYITNNPNIFKINIIDLPDKYSRDYRLTLDYKEDLDLFNKIEEYFMREKIEYSALKLLKYLDKNPELAKYNKHSSVVYRDNKELIKRINAATTIIE